MATVPQFDDSIAGGIIQPSIHRRFPFTSERPSQTDALDRIAAFLDGPKRFFILEGPTGFGKSPVAIAAAEFAGSAYIISPQKALTAQYMRDFESHGLRDLKGAANYDCGFGLDCETAAVLYGHANHIESCDGYIPAREAFKTAAVGVINFSYYLSCRCEVEALVGCPR